MAEKLMNQPLWLVEWNIAVDKRRFRFYRNLKNLQKQLGLFSRMSTMSVLLTEYARGRVHIYRAEEIG
jgi:hypothetical protein